MATYPNQNENQPKSWWFTLCGIIAALLIAIMAFYLFTEHAAHVLVILPWLILLACPLMHIFMHRHHGQHHEHDSSKGPKE